MKNRVLISGPMRDRGVDDKTVTDAEVLAAANLLKDVGFEPRIITHPKNCKHPLAFDQTQWETVDKEFDILIHVCSAMNWYGGKYRKSAMLKLSAEARLIESGAKHFYLITDPALPRENLYSNHLKFEHTRRYEEGAPRLTDAQWKLVSNNPATPLFPGDYLKYRQLLKRDRETEHEMSLPLSQGVHFPISLYQFKNGKPEVKVRESYRYDLAYAGYYRKRRAKLMRTIFEGTSSLKKALPGLASRFKSAKSRWSDKALENAEVLPPVPLAKVEELYALSAAGLLLGDPEHNAFFPLHRELQLLSLSVPIVSTGLERSSLFLEFQTCEELIEIVNRLKSDKTFVKQTLEAQLELWNEYYARPFVEQFGDDFRSAISGLPFQARPFCPRPRIGL